MQLRPEQLETKLKQQLAAVYFISGDEPLQLAECADQVRRAARKQGYTDRQVFSVEPGFDWDSLLAAANSMSLFSERRLLELRIPTAKPGERGARTLKEYAQQPPEDTLLLITAGKLEPAARRSKWVQTLESAGISIMVWPIDADRLPAWIDQRMRSRGMQPGRDVLQLMADRVEGNLLACAQEIEKIYLLNGPGAVDVDAVTESVTRSARYDVFSLVDAVLPGQAIRGQKILAGLRAEGIEPVLVLWALSRELRSLILMSAKVARGESTGRVLAASRVWEKRKAAVGGAIQRISHRELQTMLQKCAHIDRVIKGRASGNSWDELLQLTLELAGAVPVDTTCLH